MSPERVLVPGDLWPGILDVEPGVAAPLRVVVDLPARLVHTLVDECNNEFEYKPAKAETWAARLSDRLGDGEPYRVTKDSHLPWLWPVMPGHIRLDLAHPEVFDHVARKLAEFLDVSVGHTAPQWRRFARGHIHGWELVGEDWIVEFSNIRAEGAHICEELDGARAMYGALTGKAWTPKGGV